jgi:hypothetical protein
MLSGWVPSLGELILGITRSVHGGVARRRLRTLPTAHVADCAPVASAERQAAFTIYFNFYFSHTMARAAHRGGEKPGRRANCPCITFMQRKLLPDAFHRIQ